MIYKTKTRKIEVTVSVIGAHTIIEVTVSVIRAHTIIEFNQISLTKLLFPV